MGSLTRIATRFVRPSADGSKRVWYQSPETNILLEICRESSRLLSFEIDWDDRELGWCTVRWDPEAGMRTGVLNSGEGGAPVSHPKSRTIRWDPRIHPERVLRAWKLSRLPEVLPQHQRAIASVVSL